MNHHDVHINELLDYLVPWFINHTTGLDQTLIPYLIGEGQKKL